MDDEEALNIVRQLGNSKVLQQVAANRPRPGAGGQEKTGVLDELYLLILSRFPTAEEKRAAGSYVLSPKRKPLESFNDVAWALINSKEFLLKH